MHKPLRYHKKGTIVYTFELVLTVIEVRARMRSSPARQWIDDIFFSNWHISTVESVRGKFLPTPSTFKRFQDFEPAVCVKIGVTLEVKFPSHNYLPTRCLVWFEARSHRKTKKKNLPQWMWTSYLSAYIFLHNIEFLMKQKAFGVTKEEKINRFLVWEAELSWAECCTVCLNIGRFDNLWYS